MKDAEIFAPRVFLHTFFLPAPLSSMIVQFDLSQFSCLPQCGRQTKKEKLSLACLFLDFRISHRKAQEDQT
jgi:hypothetical protein